MSKICAFLLLCCLSHNHCLTHLHIYPQLAAPWNLPFELVIRYWCLIVLPTTIDPLDFLALGGMSLPNFGAEDEDSVPSPFGESGGGAMLLGLLVLLLSFSRSNWLSIGMRIHSLTSSVVWFDLIFFSTLVEGAWFASLMCWIRILKILEFSGVADCSFCNWWGSLNSLDGSMSFLHYFSFLPLVSLPNICRPSNIPIEFLFSSKALSHNALVWITHEALRSDWMLVICIGILYFDARRWGKIWIADEEELQHIHPSNLFCI